VVVEGKGNGINLGDGVAGDEHTEEKWNKHVYGQDKIQDYRYPGSLGGRFASSDAVRFKFNHFNPLIVAIKNLLTCCYSYSAS